MNQVFRKLLLAILLLCPVAAFPAQVKGSEELSAGEIRSRLQQNFEREGYLGQFRNGQQLQRAVSAYLWDNRQKLKIFDFHNAKQIEVVICLMIDKGYGNLEEYSSDRTFVTWCGKMLD